MLKSLKTAVYLTVIIFAFAVLNSYGQSNCPKWQSEIKSKEIKRLKKEFGIDLSNYTFKRVQRCKLPESGVIYFMIDLPDNSAKKFLSATKSSKRPTGVLGDFEDEECNSSDCSRIGVVFSPSDEPHEEIEKWKEETNYGSNAIANFTRIDYEKKRLKNYASFFLDTKRDLLLLWYKFKS